MNTLAISVATMAARRIGDESFGRITRSDWLDFLNATQRAISSRLPCVEYEALAATVANEDRMEMPSDLVQIRYVRYSSTPSNTASYRDLREMKLDEWRNATSSNYPSGEPTRYSPRLGWFSTYPRPSSAIANAVLLGYFGLTEDIASLESEASGLPEFMREHLIEGMVIHAKRKDKEFEEAAALEAVWMLSESRLAEKVTDRARDRRPSMRATRSMSGVAGTT